MQRKRGSAFTPEQRRARQEAMQAARAAGKDGRGEQIVPDATSLTNEQKKQIATIQKEQKQLVAKIQGEVRALLTDGQQTQLRRQDNRNAQRKPVISPTHPDLKYGPHRRNVMDVWLVESDKPTPVLVSIHGGGFRGGNNSVSGGILKACLDSGIPRGDKWTNLTVDFVKKHLGIE